MPTDLNSLIRHSYCAFSCLFNLLVFSSLIIFLSLFLFFCLFFLFFLVCLLSIFFQIFNVILYNLVCSCIFCISHIVWRHVPYDSSVQLQDAYFPVCMHLLFFFSCAKKSVSQDFCFCNPLCGVTCSAFFTFGTFFVSRWISVVPEWFRMALPLPLLASPVKTGSLGKRQE